MAQNVNISLCVIILGHPLLNYNKNNQISLAGPHTVELEQRENEQTRQRQLSDKAGREQVEVT